LRDESESLDNLGQVQQALGQWDAALESYQRCLELRERLLESGGEIRDSLEGLSLAQHSLGTLPVTVFPQAPDLLAKALLGAQRLARAYPDTAKYQTWVTEWSALAADSKPQIAQADVTESGYHRDSVTAL
jgi:tetratricopeptide (TPR) repeat protein